MSVIIDGQALVRAIGKPKEAVTFGDLANVFVSAVFSNLKFIPLCTRVYLLPLTVTNKIESRV